MNTRRRRLAKRRRMVAAYRADLRSRLLAERWRAIVWLRAHCRTDEWR